MKKILIVVLAMLAMAMFSGCGEDLKPQKVDTANAVDKASGNSGDKTESKEYKEGETVKIGESQVTLNSAKTSKGSGFEKPESGKKYVICNMTIENKGQEAKHHSTLASMKIEDEDSYTYTPTIYTKANGSLDGELAPGRKMRGEVAFQVPEKAKKMKLIYDAALFGTGQIIFNFEVK